MPIQTPRYRMHSFTTSNEDDNHQWFRVEIQLHMTLFKISVSLADFHNSPNRTDEFQKHHATLRSEYRGHYTSVNDTGLLRCFNWAVIPCLGDFDQPLASLALPPLESEQLTLSHFLVATHHLQCHLRAVDDLLASGQIERVEVDEDRWPPASPEPPAADPENPWTTIFPSFSPVEVAVIVDEEDRPFDWSPVRVRIGQQHLYFRESVHPDDDTVKREVRTHEQIACDNLKTGLQTCRLHGVVRNERNQLMGLLLHPIEQFYDPLTFSQRCALSDDERDRWTRQVEDKLQVLHLAGIIWQDANPDNVLMEVDGDAWTIEFRGCRAQGWIDIDKLGTVAGDLQGFERLVKFMGNDGITFTSPRHNTKLRIQAQNTAH